MMSVIIKSDRERIWELEQQITRLVHNETDFRRQLVWKIREFEANILALNEALAALSTAPAQLEVTH